MSGESKRLAWRVVIDDKDCIVFAPTKPKARWIAVRSYREAGYGRPDVWPNAVAAREPISVTPILARITRDHSDIPWTDPVYGVRIMREWRGVVLTREFALV